MKLFDVWTCSRKEYLRYITNRLHLTEHFSLRKIVTSFPLVNLGNCSTVCSVNSTGFLCVLCVLAAGYVYRAVVPVAKHSLK